MKAAAIAIALVTSLPVLAQDARTGVSTPPVDPQTSAQQASPADAGLPPGYRPTPPATERRELKTETYGAYTPYTPATVPGTHPEFVPESTPTGKPDADATVVFGPSGAISQPAAPQTYAVAPMRTKPSADGEVVFSKRGDPNELTTGTMLRVRVRQTLSTETTQAGSTFSAVLAEPVVLYNRVMIPSGAVLEGRVTEVKPGHRIHGTAALHLEPRRLTLPDGTHYVIHAQVIDSDQRFATRIDQEGTIFRRDHIKATLGVLGATTGASAVAGALIGGGVGAVVGAGVGAGIGTAWWLKQDRNTVIPKDTGLVFSLNEPILVGSSVALLGTPVQ